MVAAGPQPNPVRRAGGTSRILYVGQTFAPTWYWCVCVTVRTVVSILQSKLCRHYSSTKMRTLEQFRERSVIS